MILQFGPKAKVSFHVNSPNGLTPTFLDFNEIWHTCWFRPQTSDLKFFVDWTIGFWDMGGKFFENLEKISRGPTLKHHIFWTSGPIWKSKVSIKRGKVRNSNMTIIFVNWVSFVVMTFWPIFWPWNWPRKSNYKMLINIEYCSPICYLQYIIRLNT